MTPWTSACQAPLSMEFSRQEYWSGFFLTQGLNPGLLHCRQETLYHLSQQGSPVLEYKENKYCVTMFTFINIEYHDFLRATSHWLCVIPQTAATRLPRPWDSPGKKTGVGCHFLLQCMKVKSESEVAQLCPTLSDPMDCSLPGSSIHGILQAKYWSGVPLPSPKILPYYCAYCFWTAF